MLFFLIFYSSEKNNIKYNNISKQILGSTTVFNIDKSSKKCFLSIIKDHLTLKIGLMTVENSPLPPKK